MPNGDGEYSRDEARRLDDAEFKGEVVTSLQYLKRDIGELKDTNEKQWSAIESLKNASRHCRMEVDAKIDLANKTVGDLLGVVNNEKGKAGVVKEIVMYVTLAVLGAVIVALIGMLSGGL
jgi:hypothetical protein